MNHLDPLKLRLTPLPPELYLRHLGLPAGNGLDDATGALAEQARHWYQGHGRPWTHSRLAPVQSIEADTVRLDDGTLLSSRVLAEGARRSGTHSVSVLAVSAGEEVDERIAELWAEDKPDEAMFLNAYADALTEHLRSVEAEKAFDQFSDDDMTVLPYYSPGYDGWELTDQASLLKTISTSLPGPLEVLPSGGLKPSKSTLAVFAVASSLPQKLAEDYWQEIYRELNANETSPEEKSSYAFSPRALEGWKKKRLELREDGEALQAVFRFDGSTCTNLGLPLRFEYRVGLSRGQGGDYRLDSFACEPHPEDTGHKGMCSYLADAETIMDKIRQPPQLPGSSLGKVLEWSPPSSPAGCLCSESSRDHKWRIVLQTLHYSLLKES
ncbi:MAG: hypothetical protein VYC32_15360 [Planctomycetota bacterium]|nr:hypothetical protein [Planctomycetota bacterium]